MWMVCMQGSLRRRFALRSLLGLLAALRQSRTRAMDYRGVFACQRGLGMCWQGCNASVALNLFRRRFSFARQLLAQLA